MEPEVFKRRGEGRPKKKTKRPPYSGRPPKTADKWLKIEEVTPLLRARGIESVAHYKQWHDFHKVQWCPRYPNRVYKDFTTWSEYLGIANPSNFVRERNENFWSYVEARRYLHRMKFSRTDDYREWKRKHIEEGTWPDFLPRCPHRTYEMRGEWISWKDYLGTDINKKVEAVKQAAENKVWVMLQHPNEPYNVFWFRTISTQDIKSVTQKGFEIKGQYIFEDDLKQFVTQLLEKLARQHEDERKGHYTTNAMPQLMFELNTNLLIQEHNV